MLGGNCIRQMLLNFLHRHWEKLVRVAQDEIKAKIKRCIDTQKSITYERKAKRKENDYFPIVPRFRQ